MLEKNVEYNKGYAWQSIYAADKYWNSVGNFASKFALYRPNTPLSRLDIPSQTGGREAVTVGVTAIFQNNVGRLLKAGRKYGTTVDVPLSGKVGDLRQAVMDQVVAEIASRYPGRKALLEKSITLSITGMQTI